MTLIISKYFILNYSPLHSQIFKNIAKCLLLNIIIFISHHTVILVVKIWLVVIIYIMYPKCSTLLIDRLRNQNVNFKLERPRHVDNLYFSPYLRFCVIFSIDSRRNWISNSEPFVFRILKTRNWVMGTWNNMERVKYWGS